MSAKKFKFVSPGIFINEIDNSQLPKQSDPIGPVIIGRTRRGPSMRPITVNSFSEYIEKFGNLHQGKTKFRKRKLIFFDVTKKTILKSF